MDTADLAALVPSLLDRHPNFEWSVIDQRAGTLRLELHPQKHPERLAIIEVNPGAEVYFLTFIGHRAATEFAYEDGDKREVFIGIVEDAIALASGPSRVVRRFADGVEVSCEMLIDPGGPHERSLGQSQSNMVSYMRALMRGRRATEEVTNLPRITSA